MIVRSLRGIIPGPAERLIKSLGAAIPLDWRMGRLYWQWKERLKAAQDWSPERVRAWQLEHVQRILALAYQQTAGYRELFRRAGIHPDDIRSLEDIRRLPLTDKSTFQEDLQAFTVKGSGGEYHTTGGSTGIPVGFYQPRSEWAREAAFFHWAWERVGWKLGRLNAVLRGNYVGSEKKLWKYDRFHQALLLSSYYLTERTLRRYVDCLRDFRPAVLQAYPSSLDLLCRLLLGEGLVGQIGFEMILMGSENIYDWQLDRVRKVFPEATLLGCYGHAEKAVFASWCEGSRLYHVHPLYGYVELLRDDGQEAGEGEEGEVVATAFHNPCTPMIRYRTMDRAVRGPAVCEACGHRHLLFTRITGRSHELIVTGTGRLISMTAINMHGSVFDPLRQFQFFQETAGEVVFRYVPKRPLTPQEEGRICTELMAKLGSDVRLSLCPVNEIPRTRSGKLSFLEQRLPTCRGAKSP